MNPRIPQIPIMSACNRAHNLLYPLLLALICAFHLTILTAILENTESVMFAIAAGTLGLKRPLPKLSLGNLFTAGCSFLGGLIVLRYLLGATGSFFGSSRWTHYKGNPVLPDLDHSREIGTMFDISILYEQGLWKMYGSWRPKNSISYTTSKDGFTWNQNLQIALEPGNSDSSWETVVNRPFVLKRATGEYLMWYTGQVGGDKLGGKIAVAESTNGINFIRTEDNDVFRMYYSGGESYEPDAIGVAHSYDGGITWVKHGDPIFYPDPSSAHDNYKVTSPHVVFHAGWYYLFYCGFRGTSLSSSPLVPGAKLRVDLDHATVNLARSKDGIKNWEKSTSNPIVAPEPGRDSWNCDAVYKPFVAYDEASSQWLMWYNGRCGGLERIGVSYLRGDSFGSFVKRGGPATRLWY